MSGTSPRVSPSTAFGLAALLCQMLVWFVLDMKPSLDSGRLLAAHCSVVPLAMVSALVWWPASAVGVFDAIRHGLGVLLMFALMLSVWTVSLLGLWTTWAGWFSSVLAGYVMLASHLGVPLVASFAMAGYLLSDDAASG